MRETNTKTPYIPVSWGEVIDKITILEIKSERILNTNAQENIRNELNALRPFELDIMTVELTELKKKLLSVNIALWDIEEKVRQCEAAQKFDKKFIELARSVYIKNDERAKIKNKINVSTKSTLIEEKSYPSYRMNE